MTDQDVQDMPAAGWDFAAACHHRHRVLRSPDGSTAHPAEESSCSTSGYGHQRNALHGSDDVVARLAHCCSNDVALLEDDAFVEAPLLDAVRLGDAGEFVDEELCADVDPLAGTGDADLDDDLEDDIEEDLQVDLEEDLELDPHGDLIYSDLDDSDLDDDADEGDLDDDADEGDLDDDADEGDLDDDADEGDLGDDAEYGDLDDVSFDDGEAAGGRAKSGPTRS
jgi:hypothetical protein